MHRFSVLLAIGVLFTMTGYGVSQSPPSEKMFRELITKELTDHYDKNQAARFKNKVVMNNIKLGKKRKLQPTDYLPRADPDSDVYPVQVLFTLISRDDGKVQHLMAETYCYLDSFSEWSCSGGSVPKPVD